MADLRRIAVVVSVASVALAAEPPRGAPLACPGTGTAVASAASLSPEWRGTELQHAELTVTLGAHGVRNRVIAARFSPSRVRLALDVARDDDGLAPWSIDDAPSNARIAFNAGQFTDDGPWGWVIHRGREWQEPGRGSLAGAFVIDSAGRAEVLDASEIGARRARGDVREAVQSYPTLLVDGRVPVALCARDAIDRTHRDTRLAIGTTQGGDVLVVMTRYEIPGGVASRLPVGPTTPEMAALMRQLGAVRAVMLDGGLSAQLLVRDGGAERRWPGVRRVPLALVAR